MSLVSKFIDNAAKGMHAENKQLLGQLPAGPARQFAEGLSNTLASHDVFTRLAQGTQNEINRVGLHSTLTAGPPRPYAKGCGYGQMDPNAPGRRPYQFMMTVILPIGTTVNPGSFSTDVSLGEFIDTDACSMITQNNQFPSFFASDVAFMTVSCGPDVTDSQLDAIELVEKHDNEEVARYPLRTLHPRISRVFSDGTGSAFHVQQPSGPGVIYSQAWAPQRNFSLYPSSQAPAYTLEYPLLFTLGLQGSIGNPDRC